jgi:hypothetical protein
VGGAAALVVSGERVLHFEFEDGRVYVPVRAGGASPRWFILDTGAGGVVLDEGLARELGLSATPTADATGAGAGSSRRSVVAALDLAVDGVPLAAKEVSVSPLDQLLASTSGRHVGGIIGGPFFEQHVVELDFARRTLRLHDPARWRYEGTGARVPFDLDAGVPMAPAILTLPDTRRVRARVVIDLGAKATLLVPESFARKERLGEALSPSLTIGLGAGMGGDTHYTFGRVSRIAFEAAPAAGLDGAVIGLSARGSLKSEWHDGLLGAPFLSEFRVVFDYARREMILEPVARSGLASSFDRSGLFLVAQGPGLQDVAVRAVADGTPAADSGLQARDELLRVDGEPVVALGLAGVRGKLRGAAGSEVALTVRRGSSEFRVNVRLRDLIG